MGKGRGRQNLEDVPFLKPGPLGREDEHLYRLLESLSPEKRLELALEFMEVIRELKEAGKFLENKTTSS